MEYLPTPLGSSSTEINPEPQSSGAMLFELFENAELIRGEEVQTSRIANLSKSEILDVAIQSAQITSSSGMIPATTNFTHSATLSLGGGRWPCPAWKCRSRRVDELTQFAALYSDGVYIHNFFAEHAEHRDRLEAAPEDAVRRVITEDLQVMAHARPLIEAGLIIPLTTPDNHCPSCFSAHNRSDQEAKRVDAVERLLARKFLEGTKAFVYLDDEKLWVDCDGPPSLFDHPISRVHSPISEWISTQPVLRKRVQRGEKVALSKSAIQALGIHSLLAFETIRSVYFELALTQSLGTSVLAERPLHLELFGLLAEDDSVRRRNKIVQQHLTTMMPFLSDIAPADLLLLRESEAASFTEFRIALSEAIEEVMGKKDDFTTQDARQLYSDVILRPLAQLDARVQTSKNKLRKASLAMGGAWVGAISFGVYLGLLPQDMLQVGKTLGLATLASGVTALIGKGTDATEDLRSEQMYFLWRARKLAKRQRQFTLLS